MVDEPRVPQPTFSGFRDGAGSLLDLAGRTNLTEEELMLIKIGTSRYWGLTGTYIGLLALGARLTNTVPITTTF